MTLFASAARHQYATLVGPACDAREAEHAAAWFARQEVVAPVRMAALLAPAFGIPQPLLSARSR